MDLPKEVRRTIGRKHESIKRDGVESDPSVKMPAGVSWPRYIRMLGASLLAMFAGAQAVHQYYLPDLSIPEIPPKPGELRTELQGYRIREEALKKVKSEQNVD